jgi:hypothetical protein
MTKQREPTPTDSLAVAVVVVSTAVAARHYGALVEKTPVKVVLAETLYIEGKAAAGALRRSARNGLTAMTGFLPGAKVTISLLLRRDSDFLYDVWQKSRVLAAPHAL